MDQLFPPGTACSFRSHPVPWTRGAWREDDPCCDAVENDGFCGKFESHGLLLIWMNLAVVLIGSENNPANLLYLGVLCIAILGAFIARLQPRGSCRGAGRGAFSECALRRVVLGVGDLVRDCGGGGTEAVTRGGPMSVFED